MSRKAQVGMGVTPIVGIVLATIVIIVITTVILSILGVFSSSTDQETSLFLDTIVGASETLVEAGDGSMCSIQGSLDEGWGLFFFDANLGKLMQTCNGAEFIPKPISCGGERATESGCICACEAISSIGKKSSTKGLVKGADSDDCQKSSTKCYKISDVIHFRYPNSLTYKEGNFAWWDDLEPESWNFNTGKKSLLWMQAHIYPYSCGSSVWDSGTFKYILKLDKDTILIKRVPRSEDSSDLDVPTCFELRQRIDRGVKSATDKSSCNTDERKCACLFDENQGKTPKGGDFPCPDAFMKSLPNNPGCPVQCTDDDFDRMLAIAKGSYAEDQDAAKHFGTCCIIQ